jgi:hypothetical protein
MAAHEGEYEIAIPRELLGGVYANFLSVWHTPLEFTLDFCVAEPPAGDVTHVLGVARVRVPVAIIFDVIRGLNEIMTRYEEQFGDIRPPWLSSEDDEA